MSNLIVNTDPIPGRVASLLDEAADVGDMPLTDIAALRLYGNRERMNASLIEPRRNDRVSALTAYADELLPHLPQPRLAAMRAAAVPHAYNCAIRLANDLAAWDFADQRIGGCLENYRDQRLVRRDGSPTPKVARRLVSPKHIRRYVKGEESSLRMRAANTRLRVQATKISLVPSEEDRMSFLYDIERADRSYQAMRDSEIRQMLRLHPPSQPLRRRAMRSVMAAESILGPVETEKLRTGKPIIVTGNLFALRITCRSVFAIGHGALAVEILDKTTFEKLGNLCTYQPETPALDQAASTVLEITAGHESEFLAGANITSTTEAGAGHPVLATKSVTRPRAGRLVVDWRFASIHALDDRALFERYWEQHADKWIMATGVFVLGAKPWGRLARMLGGGRLLHVS